MVRGGEVFGGGYVSYHRAFIGYKYICEEPSGRERARPPRGGCGPRWGFGLPPVERRGRVGVLFL